MSIRENRFIENGSPLGGELFTFFNVGKDANGQYNYGAIPKSGYINKKSKHLPYEYTDNNVVTDSTSGKVYGRFTQLSDAMIRSINYGHNFKEYTNALEAIRDVAAGVNFPYNEPSSWFRLADLWGYDHEQPDWFSFSTRVSSLSQGGTTFVNQENLTDIFTFGRLSGLNANNVNFGFLMWNAQFSETQPQVYFYSCTDMANATQQLSSLLAADNGLQIVSSTSNGLGQGTWRMYPVVTTASFTKDSFTLIREETANGKWYPFPYANTHILTIVGAGQGEDDLIGSIDVSVDLCDISVVDAANLVFSISNLALRFENSSSAQREVNYDWSIKNALNQNNQPTTQTGKVTVPAKGSETKVLVSAKNEEDAYRFAVGETPVIMNVAYWIKTDMGDQENMVQLELESK